MTGENLKVENFIYDDMLLLTSIRVHTPQVLNTRTVGEQTKRQNTVQCIRMYSYYSSLNKLNLVVNFVIYNFLDLFLHV